MGSRLEIVRQRNTNSYQKAFPPHNLIRAKGGLVPFFKLDITQENST